MSRAAALLDRLGHPSSIRLGTASAARTDRLPTGLASLDALLGGGLPRGQVSEIAGRHSAGRTALACRVAATTTARGEIVAWVDPDNALDPEMAAAAGVHLDHTLWVRPRRPGDAPRAAELLLETGGFALVVLDLAESSSSVRASSVGRSAAGTWTRLARAAQRTGSTLLVVGSSRQAGVTAAFGLELGPHRTRWSGGRGRPLLLEGITVRITVARSRTGAQGRTLVVHHAACA